MYSKPTLEKFGSFRNLTQVGFSGGNDGYIILGPPNDDGPPTSDVGCDLLGCTSS